MFQENQQLSGVIVIFLDGGMAACGTLHLEGEHVVGFAAEFGTRLEDRALEGIVHRVVKAIDLAIGAVFLGNRETSQ